MFELITRNRRNPFLSTLEEFDGIKEFNDIFSLFECPSKKKGNLTRDIPKVELLEEEDKYVVSAELPGVEKEDITLDITEEGILKLKGEKKEDRKEENSKVRFTEISYGALERSIQLPEDVNKEKINAEFKNGTIEISLPKKIEKKKCSKKISIK
jgi:HSP20 family protein